MTRYNKPFSGNDCEIDEEFKIINELDTPSASVEFVDGQIIIIYPDSEDAKNRGIMTAKGFSRIPDGLSISSLSRINSFSNSTVVSTKGKKGETGLTGVKGETGIQGEKGTDGIVDTTRLESLENKIEQISIQSEKIIKQNETLQKETEQLKKTKQPEPKIIIPVETKQPSRIRRLSNALRLTR